MRALAWDTSTPAVGVALVELGPPARVRAAREQVAENRHGELLAPAIEAVLAEAGVTLADVDALVVGVGPGPFTGLRVGLVTAAALADATGVPAYGVCSLDAIAARHRGDGDLVVATDARRREVYWARYDAAGARLSGPAVDRPADLAAGLDGEVRLAGAGALAYREVLGVPVGRATPYPDPVALVELAAARITAGAPGEALTPLYLRRPDASPPGRPKAVTPA